MRRVRRDIYVSSTLLGIRHFPLAALQTEGPIVRGLSRGVTPEVLWPPGWPGRGPGVDFLHTWAGIGGILLD